MKRKLIYPFILLLEKITGDLSEFTPLEQFKTRLSIGIMIGENVIIASIGIILWAAFEEIFAIYMILIFVAVIIITTILYFHYRTKNIVVTGNAFILTMACIIFTGTTLSRGINSPALSIMILIPVFSILITTRKASIFWTILTILVFCLQFLFAQADIKIPVFVYGENIDFINFLLWIFSTLVIVFSLLIFDQTNIKLSNQLYKEKEKFELLSLQDSLTGLHNRLYFELIIEKLIELHEITQKGFTIFLLDLNNLKTINDNYGHLAGDALLKCVAEALKRTFRDSDHLIRMGGDEFYIILENALSKNDAMALAEKLLENSKHPFQYDGNELRCSASIGISFFPQHGNTSDAIMASVDQAMYTAKTGKDSISILDYPNISMQGCEANQQNLR
jgi:diguanylate cyclase (GGDEF)-like protein